MTAIWARFLAAEDFCAIAHVGDDYARTECAVMYAATDVTELGGTPSADRRCQRCVTVLVERRYGEWQPGEVRP